MAKKKCDSTHSRLPHARTAENTAVISTRRLGGWEEAKVKYVVEFAKALAQMPEVYRVNLLTRQISSPEIDSSYGEPTEMLTSNLDEEIGGAGGAYLVRIPCGENEKYYEKEHMWPYIPEFVDGALGHILNISKVLGDLIGGGRAVWPHVIHGHYVDAGYAACLLFGALNVPMVLTGHSLGRNKLEQILKQGEQPKEEINRTYKIFRRIGAEELCLDSAELMFIPPGMDFSNVIVQEESTNDDLENASAQLSESPLWGE
ncbi:hypothetical protein KI387_043087, partial [Taxus chinensis]